MENDVKIKTFNDSYLFNRNADSNQKILFQFIMDGQQIDVNSDAFEDVR